MPTTDDVPRQPESAGLTPAATRTPELVRDIRARAERRDRKGWEYTMVPVETVYALCDAAEALAGALAEVERLRRALAFYADPEHWTLRKETPGSPWVTAGAAWPDKGARARAALDTPATDGGEG